MQYSEFVLDVISQIPTAPDFVITKALNRTTRRFCDATTAYRYKVDGIVVAEDEQTVNFTIPDQTAVSSIHHVRWGDKKLDPATDKFISVIGDKREVGRPDYFIWRDSTSFILQPVPQQEEEVLVEMSLRPTVSATEIPDWFAEKYYEVLIAGTCAEMSRTPDTEYYNPELFKVMEAYYNAGSVEAKKEAYGADRSVPRRVRYGGY